MISLLPKWVIANNKPAFYDTESATVIEMTSKVYGAMNKLIDEYNTFVETINAEIEAFEMSSEKNYELFAVSLRQEFQDFIDTIELKVKAQDKTIADKFNEQDTKIADTINYMKNNLAEGIRKVVSDMLESGEFNDAVISALSEITKAIEDEATARQNAILAYKVKTPEMYGAIGDGVTDDTNAFIAMLNDFNANNFSIMLVNNYALQSNSLPTITKSGFHIFGNGHNSGIVSISDDGVLFNIEAMDFIIDNFSVVGSGTCAIFDFYLSNNGFVRNLCIRDVYIFARLLTSREDNSIVSLAPTFENINGEVKKYFIHFIKGHNGITINNCSIDSEEEYHATFLSLSGNYIDTIRILNCLVQQFDYCIECTVKEGEVVQNIFCFDTVFDTIFHSCVFLKAVKNSVLDRIIFKDTWFSVEEPSTVAVNILGDGDCACNIEFDGCSSCEAEESFLIINQAKNVKVTNCSVYGHSNTTDGYGMRFISCENLICTNNQIGNDPKLLQKSNIGVELANCTNTIFTNNILIDNVQGASISGTSGIIANNLYPEGENHE